MTTTYKVGDRVRVTIETLPLEFPAELKGIVGVIDHDFSRLPAPLIAALYGGDQPIFFKPDEGQGVEVSPEGSEGHGWPLMASEVELIEEVA